jgi:hypothetical protein
MPQVPAVRGDRLVRALEKAASRSPGSRVAIASCATLTAAVPRCPCIKDAMLPKAHCVESSTTLASPSTIFDGSFEILIISNVLSPVGAADCASANADCETAATSIASCAALMAAAPPCRRKGRAYPRPLSQRQPAPLTPSPRAGGPAGWLAACRRAGLRHCSSGTG